MWHVPGTTLVDPKKDTYRIQNLQNWTSRYQILKYKNINTHPLYDFSPLTLGNPIPVLHPSIAQHHRGTITLCCLLTKYLEMETHLRKITRCLGRAVNELERVSASDKIAREASVGPLQLQLYWNKLTCSNLFKHDSTDWLPTLYSSNS